MSWWLRLDRKQNISLNAFWIRIFLSRSYSFGIEMINTFIHSRSSLENHTRFQSKMGKVYTRFQTKRDPKPYPLGRHIPMALPGEATRESYYVKFTRCLEKPLQSVVTQITLVKPFLFHVFSRAFDIIIWFAVIEATKSIDKIIYLSLGVTFAILLLFIAVFVWCYRRMKKKTIERFVQLCLLHCTVSVRHVIKSWRRKTNAKALRKLLSNFISRGNKYNVVHLSSDSYQEVNIVTQFAIFMEMIKELRFFVVWWNN